MREPQPGSFGTLSIKSIVTEGSLACNDVASEGCTVKPGHGGLQAYIPQALFCLTRLILKLQGKAAEYMIAVQIAVSA